MGTRDSTFQTNVPSTCHSASSHTNTVSVTPSAMVVPPWETEWESEIWGTLEESVLIQENLVLALGRMNFGLHGSCQASH
jgi:hypothetical protein